MIDKMRLKGITDNCAGLMFGGIVISTGVYAAYLCLSTAIKFAQSENPRNVAATWQHAKLDCSVSMDGLWPSHVIVDPKDFGSPELVDYFRQQIIYNKCTPQGPG